MHSAIFFFVHDRADDFKVHWAIADPGYFRGYARPMNDSFAVSGEPSAGGQALGVVVGRGRALREENTSVVPDGGDRHPPSLKPV
ncbi:hypothetical protein [Pseudorhodoplanes sp.]|uniref:hypothetical protein n=1 Tax=Pseudorhodoplanes sp. TaxID=1934341 RepID=UPI00391AAFF3